MNYFMSILKHDQSKINKLNQCLTEKCDHIVPSSAWQIDQMKIALHATTKWFTIASFCSDTHELVKILCAILIGSTVQERSFSCIWQINDWLSISLLKDQLGDFAITAVHSHTILILKTDIYSAFMRIHPPRMMSSSLFIDSWFIKYLYIFIHWYYDSNIWRFTKKLNPTACSLNSRAFISTLLYEL